MESVSCTGPVHYRTAAVGGLNVFYREAGPDSAAPKHQAFVSTTQRSSEHGAAERESRQAA